MEQIVDSLQEWKRDMVMTALIVQAVVCMVMSKLPGLF